MMKSSHWLSIVCFMYCASPCQAKPLPETVNIELALNPVLDVFNKFVQEMPTNVTARQRTILTEATGKCTITQNAANPAQRAAVIQMRSEEFIYGSPLGGGPSYPNGNLGLARNVLDWLDLQVELLPQIQNSLADAYDAFKGLLNYGGLRTMKDYTKLYDGQWKRVLPRGPNTGLETNYTQDLLFSMGRLSTNPYAVRRLDPTKDKLSFQVDDATAKAITTSTQSQLLETGRLFYADFRNQKNFPRNSDTFAAAVDAYFYIHPNSGNFLPLAIRTNVGANLIYTPRDTENDWMLAKIMYNVNDFWHAQWNHYTATHEVVQIAYMAAIRTMSNEHPVLTVLNRLMWAIFSFPPVAKTLLFTSGMVVDRVFAFPGPMAEKYCNDRYLHDDVGRFQANFYYNELRSRGMIDAEIGPALKHFPFHEDAHVIYDEQRKFFTTFVESYYSDESAIKADKELQAWADEANGPASARDFPRSFTRATLADTLTHFAHLITSTHHTLNLNMWIEASNVLPLQPAALYKEIPTTKGIKNPADWLPPFRKVVESVAFGSWFARPLLRGTNRTLLHAFDDQEMLARMNPQVVQAAEKFQMAMKKQSSVVAGRTFDKNGLSQGMPFIFNGLDPNRMPYCIAI